MNINKKLNYINDLLLHDVVHETIERFNAVEDLYEEITSSTSNSAMQKSLIDLEYKLRTNESCDFVTQFFIDNKDIIDIPIFNSLKDFNKESITNKCKSIGNGYNNKGFDAAIKSLISYIDSKYKDFHLFKRDDILLFKN